MKMYFKNVTNYPMACNHSFRAIIGLSCKYLIRGLGKWGGWEGPASPGLLAASPSPGPGETLGSPCDSGRGGGWGGGGGTFPGSIGGSDALAPWTGLGPARIHTRGILKLPSLMETNCPSPPPPSMPREYVLTSNDSQMCPWLPTFLFSPKEPSLLWFCPYGKDIYCPR